MEKEGKTQLLWPITPPYVPEDGRLSSFLSNMKKEDLNFMRSFLEIRGASRLNKGDLIEKIAFEITEKLENILKNFDEERLDYVEKLRRNNGFLVADRIPYHKVIYYILHGIAFPGILKDKRVLFMPEEVKEFFYGYPLESFRDSAKHNTEIITLTIGMLNYYGVLSIDKAKNQLEKHMKLAVDKDGLFEILYNAAAYYDRLEYQEGLLTDSGVMEPEYILAEHHKRSEVEYYPFKYKELWAASKINYIDITPQVEKFLEYLKSHFGLSHDDALDIYCEFNFSVLNDAPIFEAQQKIFDKINIKSKKELEGFVPVIMEMYNHTGLWVLKGFCPEELQEKNRTRAKPASNVVEMPRRVGSKIERNDPCPCGSGKKYKKCCLE